MQTKSVVTEDKHKICYDHYENGFDKLIIIAHGFFNSKDAVLLKNLGQELGDKYDVAMMDFRGHGQSGGLFYWTTKEYIDLIAVLKDVRPRYKKIGLIGFSLGGATSLIAASKVDLIDSLIAVSAPTEFRKIEYHFWDLDIENDVLYNIIGDGKIGKGIRPGPFWQKKDKPITVVQHIKAPTLFLHGGADWLIKPRHSKELYDKATCQKKLAIIEGGPHAEYLIRKKKDETVSLIKQWFEETLSI